MDKFKEKFVSNPDEMEIVDDGSLKVINVDEEYFKGDVALIKFEKINKPYMIKNSTFCIANDGYKWIEFYDYNSKAKLTAIYDENNEIVEWYFDVAREIGKENGMPYEDDLYLDVVLTPKGDTILLDEDELKEAYERMEMTKDEYDEAYKIANDLIKKIKGKQVKVKIFTDKYLKEIGV